MTATKEQERKALEQIKKIVKGLGDDSYIAAAFEGCFEMAESNIESDFGCSYKQSYEKALEDENYYKDLAERKSTEKDELQMQLDNMRRQVLNKNDLEMVQAIVCFYEREQGEKVREYESKILETCENPSSDEFQRAVRNRRSYKKADEQAKGIAARLSKIKEAY